MFSNSKLVPFKQRQIKKHAENSDSYSFFNLLTGSELLSTVESLLPEHRERLFPPTETLSMFLAQALSQDRSCQKVVNDAAINRLVGGLSPCSTATGGYCKARIRLPLTMLSTLVRHTGQLIDNQAPSEWRWQGKLVRLVDGTTVSMPDRQKTRPFTLSQTAKRRGLASLFAELSVLPVYRVAHC